MGEMNVGVYLEVIMGIDGRCFKNKTMVMSWCGVL